jgi:hypothetical protein
MTVYIIDLEAVETRYTSQWKTTLPNAIRKVNKNVEVISGPEDIPSATTPGAFLNFGGTNIYKSRQTEEISRLFTSGKVKAYDHFLFTDAWHPGIINLKYMSELLSIPIKIHALWHAGSYDPQDFLGRLIGDKPWVRHAEKAFFNAIDYNYFATSFHIEMFVRNLLNDYPSENPWLQDDLNEALNGQWPNIVRTGYPMEYFQDTFAQYQGMKKRDLILFPHRIAPEKQVNIFRDLKELLPQYEFVVCQDQQLTKNEYHNLLAEAKIVFSANLQETLGISCYEGCVLNAIPMVPDRLSYREMYFDTFKYPSNWTDTWDHYMDHRQMLVKTIIDHMEFYETRLPILHKQTEALREQFFTGTNLYNNLR